MQKTVKQLGLEKEKSKLRIQKLIQRKGKFDSGFKTCKNCGKEYPEKENYNWSCRMHQSDYGGEMWWCCGKIGKDQPGCKFSMHESKDDEDEETNEEQDNDKQKSKKYVRCTCCKEIGHLIHDCTRDPNIKTGAKADQEFDRIQKMKDFRKLYADSIVTTTHLLKKAVMIPIKYDEEGNQEEVSHAYNPFMRGVMEFDDYNYSVHNPYVLVEDPKYADDDKQAKGAKDVGVDSSRSGPPPAALVNTGEQMDPYIFSKQIVNSSVTEEYEHNLVTIEPSEMELEKAEQARQEAIAQEEAAKEKLRKEQEKNKRKGSKMSNSALTSQEDQEDKGGQEGEGGDDSKKGSEKDDAEDDDEEGYEYSFRVYYRKEEIRMANAMQIKDQFGDLMTMRHNTIIENQENPQINKFNIMDFQPREKSPAASIAKKKNLKSGASQKKKGMILGFDEEEED